MSATGDFTPPEFPSGLPQEPPGARPGVPVGAAVGILAAVAALGVAAVFTLGHTKSHGSTLVAQPGASASVPGHTPGASPTPAPTASSSGDTSDDSTDNAIPTGTDTAADDGGDSGDGGDSSATSAYTPEFYVGECVDTSGSGSDFTVNESGCSGADYKIIYAFQNETGDIDTDMSRCYTIDGNDNEFENGDAGDGYTLYCMNSLTGDYSPRRAGVDNCLDSGANYEVDCSSSHAAWIVVGRLNGTTNTKGCSQFGSYDNSYYWSSAPSFVLCVDKYKH